MPDPGSTDPRGGDAERIAALEAELADQTRLVHEIDHRVKNNLQLIGSLILLQRRRHPDEAARDVLRTVLERVNAVSAAHRNLNRGGDPQRFEAAELVRELVA